jgi:proteasome lid subunit RPN8/RPN11
MLILNENIKQQLQEDAFRTFPDECCGFFFGNEQGEERKITEILVVENAKSGDKRRRFEITAKDYLNAELYAEKKSLTLLGIYHSHPNHPSIPSEHDRIAAQPFFSYIIISVNEKEIPSIQSWILNDNFQFEEEKILEIKSVTP